jgi:ABC-type transport system involved in multi-copper enzyme maturation permease subunit
VTYGDVLRSEWTKFWTVKSTYWTLLVTAVLSIGLGALFSGLAARRYHSDLSVRIGWNPTDHSLRSLLLGQLAFAVLGVMIVTSEYVNGMIRTSLTAVPKRFRMMSAKLLVLLGVLLVAGQIIAFATFGVGQALIHGNAPSASLGQHLVLRAVIGAGLYLAAVGMLGAAFAVLFRNTAIGIVVVVAMLFVLPGLILALPNWLSNPISQWWPTNAGRQVAIMARDAHTLPAWGGFAWLVVFVAAVTALGLYLLDRRDA